MGDSGVSWSKLPLAAKTTMPVSHHSGFYRLDALLPPNRRPGNHNNVSVGGAVIVTGSVKTTETERRVAFQVRSEKMAKHLEIMNKRYNELERRRNLEVEGFKTDIRQLRGRLKDVEKQLYKVRRRQLFSSA